jgi:hypothetical protein
VEQRPASGVCRVDPGVHTLRVVLAPGRERVLTLTFADGESKSVPLAEADGTAHETNAPPVRRTVGFVLGGIGVAALAASGVFGALALSKKSVVDGHCDADGCDQDGLDAKRSGSTLATVSTVAFVAGAAALATGLFFVFTKPSSARVGVGAAAMGAGGGAVLRADVF